MTIRTIRVLSFIVISFSLCVCPRVFTLNLWLVLVMVMSHVSSYSSAELSWSLWTTLWASTSVFCENSGLCVSCGTGFIVCLSFSGFFVKSQIFFLNIYFLFLPLSKWGFVCVILVCLIYNMLQRHIYKHI